MNVAYLAPELTGLSATFVYKEIIGLKKKNFNVSAYSVHKPVTNSRQAEILNQPVTAIYDKRILAFIWVFFRSLITNFDSTKKTLSACKSDLNEIDELGQKLKLLYHCVSGIWLSSQLKDQNIQHLHIHFGHVPTQIGMYAALHYDCPFTFTVHANDLFQRPLLYRSKGNRAKAVITISDFNKSQLTGYGIPENKILLVRCGVSHLDFEFQPKKVITAPFRIIVVARLVHKKGIDTLIHSIQQLKDRGFDCLLEIIGDGPERDALESKVNSFRIEQNVNFRGSVTNHELPKYFSQQDIFVLPARKDKHGDMDGIPVVLMEAMSYGIPVISTNISGIPELVRDKKTGLLISPDSPGELTSAIVEIIENEGLRSEIISGARNIIENEFSFETNLNKLIRVFVDNPETQ